MADRFYSVIAGEKLAAQVTEGSSTSGEAIELRINDTAYTMSKVARYHAVQAILQYLLTKEGNPIS